MNTLYPSLYNAYAKLLRQKEREEANSILDKRSASAARNKQQPIPNRRSDVDAINEYGRVIKRGAPSYREPVSAANMDLNLPGSWRIM